MTSADELPRSDDERLDVNALPNGPGGSEDDVLDGGDGIGATSTEEPDTFEPEESPE